MYSLAPTTDAFEFTQFSISYPSFFPLLLLSFNLGTSDHVYSVAPGSGVVLQQHKPQLDGCQCPFSNRSLQKANSGQGSAGSPTDLWAAPSARQSTSAGLPELPPLPRADATSEHQGYFQPAGVKLPFFSLCSHHYLPIKGTLFFCQLIPRD